MNQPRAVARGEWLWLAGVIALGAALRTYIWFNGYAQNGVHGLFRHGDGYLQIAATFADGGQGFFEHWRAKYQFIYPLYLGPLYAFGLDDSTYIFWLHHAYVAGTILCLYFAARRLFGVAAGMLTAFVYALHVQMAYWFNWALSDTAFHFQLSVFLFCLVLCAERVTTRRVVALAIATPLMMFTRPDGFIVVGALTVCAVFGLLAKRLGSMRALATCAVLAVSGVAALSFLIAQNRQIRDGLLSHINVGWMLYYGSQRTPTRAAAVDEMILEMHRYGEERAAADPEGRNKWYWASMRGLERVRARPLLFVAYWGDRLASVLFPAFYREGVSLRYRLIDHGLGLFLYAGAAIALLTPHRTRRLSRILVFTALCMYLFISSIQSEWDVRVQLSPHVLLLPLAAFGWVTAAGWLAARSAMAPRPSTA